MIFGVFPYFGPDKSHKNKSSKIHKDSWIISNFHTQLSTPKFADTPKSFCTKNIFTPFANFNLQL